MEFHSSLPPGAAEQLARVSRGIVNQGPQLPAADALPKAEYARVGDFFDRHADTFSTIESYWLRVKEAKKEVEAFAATPIMPVNEHLDEQGVAHVEISELQSVNRDGARAGRGTINTRHFIADCNQRAHKRVTEAIATGVLTLLSPDYNLREFTESMIDTSPTRPDETGENKVLRQRFQAEGALADEIRERAAALIDANKHAFLGQYVGIHELRRLLAVDEHVLPFVDSLQELITLSGRGVVKFPGLLETLQAHIAESRIKGRENSLKAALGRVASQLTPQHAFTSSFIDIPPGREAPRSPKLSKEFLHGVAAVRNAARVISLDENTGITPGDLARRIAEHLDMMPGTWQEAYKVVKEGAVQTLWNDISVSLSKFERSDRLVSNIKLTRTQALR